MRTPLPMPLWARILLSVFVVVQVLAGAANVSRETGPGKAVRAWTKPWEKVLGVHQTWPMFAVPPRSTTTVRSLGTPRRGDVLLLRTLPGEPPFDGVVWLYSRGGKLERNTAAKKRSYLRESIAGRVCEARPNLAEVRFDRVARRTPLPRFGSPYVPRSEWPIDVKELQTVRCRR